MDVGMSWSNPGFQSLAKEHVFFVFWAVLFAIACKVQKNNMGNKKQWFYDFESVEKTVVNSFFSCVKSYQRKTNERIEFLTFITNCKSFGLQLFCYVFNRFEISIKFSSFDTCNECLPTKFVFASICTFCKLNSKTRTKRLKKKKNFFL